MAIVFKDEVMSFRDFKCSTVTKLDLVFKKCPVCGAERIIYDEAEYPFKIKRNGRVIAFFDKESCKRKFLAAHPELEHKNQGKPRNTEGRAERAKKYLELFHKGLTYREIGERFGITVSAVMNTIRTYQFEADEERSFRLLRGESV